ncbi:hypothetical protein AAHC03_026278 [Spirometra sp. Aus1]
MGDGITPELKAQTAASLVLLAPPREVEDVVKEDVSPVEPNDKEAGSIELEPWRQALEDKLTAYITEKFPTGAVSVFAPFSEKPSMIYIFIEGNIRKQFSSGRWRSSWVIEFPKNYKGSNLNVTGDVKVQTHIFEQGNVQLMSSKKHAFEVVAASPEALACDVTSKIAEFDTDYQTALGLSLDSLSSNAFKALRRQLPMTRAKVEWNKIAAYQVGAEISRTS